MTPGQRAARDAILAQHWMIALGSLKFAIGTIEDDTPWTELSQEAYEYQLETLTQLQTLVGRIEAMTWPPPRGTFKEGRSIKRTPRSRTLPPPPADGAGSPGQDKQVPAKPSPNHTKQSSQPSGDGPEGRFPITERSPR